MVKKNSYFPGPLAFFNRKSKKCIFLAYFFGFYNKIPNEKDLMKIYLEQNISKGKIPNT